MRFRYLLGTAALTLLAHAAPAQQPVLPGAPTAPPPAVPTPAPAPVPGAPVPEAAPAKPSRADEPILNHRYEVKLPSGLSFTGVLRAISVTDLTFDAVGIGSLTVSRSNLVQLRDLDATVADTRGQLGRRRSYYDIGSGSRYFFGPSGRNLRAGEGVVQDVWVFLAGVNYGITDNFSIGGYMSLIPYTSLNDQVYILTPKVGVSLGTNVSLGAGVLYMHLPGFGQNSINTGVLYGVVTKGSADDNISGGLGYGFVDDNIGSTPALYLAGQKRISRRFSLMSENYFIVNDGIGGFGIYGFKVNWTRVNLGVAAGYLGYADKHSSNFGTSYFLPVYLDFSYRFGKPYQRQ